MSHLCPQTPKPLRAGGHGLLPQPGLRAGMRSGGLGNGGHRISLRPHPRPRRCPRRLGVRGWPRPGGAGGCRGRGGSGPGPGGPAADQAQGQAEEARPSHPRVAPPCLAGRSPVDFTLSTPSSARPQNRLGLNVSPPRPLPAGTAPGRPSGHPRSRRSSRGASLRCPGARAPFPYRGLCGKRLPLPRVASLPFCSLGSPPSSSVSRNFSGSRTCARGQRSRTRHRLQQREPEAS